MLRSSICQLAKFFIPILGIVGCSRDNGPINNFHPYGVQHGALHLEYFGDTRGTVDFFFDHYGNREAHITHSELMTDKGFRPTITYSVRKIASVTDVDSVKGEAVRLIDKTLDSLYHLSPGDVPSPEKQFASFFGSEGYVPIGDTIIHAQLATIKARVWQQGEQQSYLFEFNGIIVGTYTDINGNINEIRLISMDTANAIDTMRFVPPNGFPVKDMTKERPNMPNDQP